MWEVSEVSSKPPIKSCECAKFTDTPAGKTILESSKLCLRRTITTTGNKVSDKRLIGMAIVRIKSKCSLSQMYRTTSIGFVELIVEIPARLLMRIIKREKNVSFHPTRATEATVEKGCSFFSAERGDGGFISWMVIQVSLSYTCLIFCCSLKCYDVTSSSRTTSKLVSHAQQSTLMRQV